MKISACVIARDEEKNLPRWIASMQRIADEMVVVDTGSTDKTPEIARLAGARVYAFDWCDDFSAAKNFAIERAAGDWIIFCDADEYFPEEDVKKVRALVRRCHEEEGVLGILCPLVNIDLDRGGAVIEEAVQLRIFRNLPDLRFVRPVHEALSYTGRETYEAQYTREIRILHTGYSKHSVREKCRRNIALLERKKAEGRWDASDDYYMADACYGVGDYEKALGCARRAARAGVKLEGLELRCYGLWMICAIRCHRPAGEIQEAWDSGLRAFPKAPIFSLFGAEWAKLRGDFAEEERLLRQALAEHTASLKKERRAGALTSEGIHAAIPEIEKRLSELAQLPKAIEAQRGRIYAALEGRDFPRAEREIEVLLPAAPTEALGLLTSCRIEAGETARAAEALERLRAVAPEAYYTRFLAARVAVMEWKWLTARDLLAPLMEEAAEDAYRAKSANLFGRVARILGEPRRAAAAYLSASAAALRAGDRLSAAAEYSNYLFTRHYLPPEPPAEERTAAAAYSAFWREIRPFFHRRRRRGEKIRVGYLSPDLRQHVVLCFSEVMMCDLDDRFSVYAYHTSPDDAYSRALAAKVAIWRNLAGCSPETVARAIYDDAIDILVDLSGHTAHGNLPALAYKPAPVIVSGIGYFASTGLPAVDYFLGDAIMDRAEEQEAFTETLLRLPHSHFCYTPYNEKEPALVPAVRQKGHITFGSFNQFAKLSKEVLSAWREILERVPGSRLLLKTDVFDNEEDTAYALKKLADAGLDTDRIDREGVTRDYLDRYRDVDIALDTFPYPGGGTTADALYMGVPVVALTGKSHGGRFPLSLLTNAGIGELCAPTIEAYIDRAVALASDVDTLTLLHENLRHMMKQSPLLDAAAYGRELSDAYAAIWEKYLREQKAPSYEKMRQLKKAYDGFVAAGDNRQALAAADRILAADPRNDEWRIEFAERYIDGGDSAGAELALAGVSPSGWRTYLYAQVAMLRGGWQEALVRLAEALADTNLPQWQLGAIHSALATCHKRLGDHRAAAEEYLASCRGKTLETGLAQEYSNYLLSLHYYEEDAEKLLAAARGYGELFGDFPALAPAGGYGHDRLRIGFISPDFRRHVVAAFALPFFEGRGEGAPYVIGYYTGDPDDVTGRIGAAADAFFDLRGLTPEEQARKIQRDEIDILVDLSGHTGGSALPVLAYRPAPVQVSGIGYFDTTGLPAVDYFLVDAVTAPEGEEAFFTERLLRMRSHLCYTPLLIRPVNTELPSVRSGYVTFGCLGNADKLTEGLLILWREILTALPTARLHLQAAAYGDRERLALERTRMERLGLPLERITFAGYQAEYLAAYEAIDIALDTWPYPGGGTTCDALYMGVPVVSLYGAHHHSRFGLSMLSAVGLTEACAAASGEEYVQKACSLAENEGLRRELRASLRARMEKSPLMDGGAYRRELLEIYGRIAPKKGK